MDKITLPLTKDVDQKVIGSVIEEPTKGMLVAIPTVVILMLLFIPDGSSHWSWLTAWFCLGPIILVVGIDHFVAPSRRQEPIKWLDCEKLSPEISELKSDMIEVGYTLTSDEGFNLPHYVELSDTSLITKFPRTLYPHEIGIFSRSTMLLSFHGLTPLGKNLKLALKRELDASLEEKKKVSELLRIEAERKEKERIEYEERKRKEREEREERERKEREEREELKRKEREEAERIEREKQEKEERDRKEREELERRKQEERERKERDRKRREEEAEKRAKAMRDAMALKSKLEKNRKAFIKKYFSESEAKSRYHPEFNKELLALFDRTQYHVHEFQEANFSRTVNQQFWEPLGKPKVDEEFPLSSVWMLRQIKELTPASISDVKQKIRSWQKGIVGEMDQHLNLQINLCEELRHYDNLMQIWMRCNEFEEAVEVTDRLFRLNKDSIDENDFEYIMSDMGIERQ